MYDFSLIVGCLGVCCVQGVGQLFPWNVFINAEDYFRRRLCGSAFENNFENCISAGYNLAAITGLLLALRWVTSHRNWVVF